MVKPIFSSSSIFSFAKIVKPTRTIPFKEYYNNWYTTLKNPLLPLLHQSLSSSAAASPALLTSHLNLLLHHFLSYYDSLDLAVSTDPNNLPHLLFPSWKSSLEKPFLFLGDLHPYVFTNLLRSIIDHENNQETEKDTKRLVLDRPWQVMMAWKDPPDNLITKIEEIERGLRLMVPALVDRMKRAQVGFVGRVAEDWGSQGVSKEGVEIGGAMKVEMEELVSVFLDANRLRRSVISEIVGALNVYQGALFLESLAQFLVGFNDPDLVRQFERCKIPLQ